jgi:hypothetical protein
MSKLLYSSFFPEYPGGQALRWYLWGTLKEIPRVFKAKWQRSTRGWADCDVWSIDSWFQHVMPGMLRRLANNKMGCPMEMFSEEEIEKMNHGDSKDIDDEAAHQKWFNILHRMADDLDAHNEFWNNYESYGYLSTQAFSKAEQKAQERVLRGVDSFRKWFYALWD